MGRRDASKTGANTEPLPFVRRFGGGEDDEAEEVPDELVELPQLPNPMEYTVSPLLSHLQPQLKTVKEEGRSPRRRSRSRDSHGDHAKSKKRKRSRSREGSRRRRRSGSRERSRSRERRRRRRSHSRSRSPRRSEFEAPPPRAPIPPIPANANLPAPMIEVAARLPPQLRGQVVAQSLLVKPEALPDVINQAVASSGVGGIFGTQTPVDGAKERKRKSRWSTTKQFVPGMVTILPSNLDDNQRKGYLLQLEIEEATRKLRLAEFVPPDGVERSPSPEPVYDSNGKRLNTREVRKRQELEQLRHEKIQSLLKLNPAYKPPADYRAPNIRLHDKVYIPQDAHPEINFVGLLIGPRGNTLKSLEAETQAKIIIRGKGSVKEGKLGRRDGPMPGENEPLHAFVTGADRDVIKKACARIQEIINAALLIPDGQNELRKLQLRELAVLNGTLRPEDIMNSVRCSNCGSDQHKTWECPDAPNVTANIVCTACGNAGHIARDCKNPRTGYEAENGMAMDDEYSALMAELGEKPSNSQANQPVQGVAQFGTFRQQQMQQFGGAESVEDDHPAAGRGGFRGRGAYGYGSGRGSRGGGASGTYNQRKYEDNSSYGYGTNSTASDPVTAYMNQWAAGMQDYGNGYEHMSATDLAAYYQHYGMDASAASWAAAAPPLPPGDQTASSSTDFSTLIAPPPPPPES